MPREQTPAKPAGGSPASPAAITRQHSRGLDLTTVAQGAMQELHATLRPLPGESPSGMVGRLGQVLRESGAVIARQEVFGDLAVHAEILSALHKELGELCWPVTYVQGRSCQGHPLSGMHVLAVSGAPVQTVRCQGQPVGRTYDDGWARHLLLGNLLPANARLDRPTQARQVYELIDAGLQAGGMGIPDLARTWLFIQKILDWYGPFNEVRTEFYQRKGVFDRVVPASTGVSGENTGGHALTAAAWASRGSRDGFVLQEVLSPKQCPAPAYGSSFSRAVELASPALRRVMVSGTASIAPGGASVCQGDVEAQIDVTMEVVRAILVSRGLDYPDVSRATAYFKRPEDVKHFEAWRKRLKIREWPAVVTEADICRDELLFEIELDALGSRRSSS